MATMGRIKVRIEAECLYLYYDHNGKEISEWKFDRRYEDRFHYGVFVDPNPDAGSGHPAIPSELCCIRALIADHRVLLAG